MPKGEGQAGRTRGKYVTKRQRILQSLDRSWMKPREAALAAEIVRRVEASGRKPGSVERRLAGTAAQWLVLSEDLEQLLAAGHQSVGDERLKKLFRSDARKMLAQLSISTDLDELARAVSPAVPR